MPKQLTILILHQGVLAFWIYSDVAYSQKLNFIIVEIRFGKAHSGAHFFCPEISPHKKFPLGKISNKSKLFHINYNYHIKIEVNSFKEK
jgi:hypothetical protein